MNITTQVTTLPSGLRVATDTMPGVETVSLGVWVEAGTRDEAAELNGIAHLLEHMAFKGTTTRSARVIAEVIEDVGGHLNAYTSREHTAYYAKLLRQDAALGLDIVADILQNSVFDTDELARERQVVLQEIGQAFDTPDDIVFDHFQETAFPDQPLGRPVLGRPEIVARIESADLDAYLKQHYSAGSMVAVAAGAIEHDRFVELVATAFADLPAGSPTPRPRADYRGGAMIERRDTEQAHVVFGFPGLPHRDPDYYALAVYSMALGGGMSSRLFQEVREKRGLVYSIYSFSSSYRDDGLFGIYAGTGPDSLAELSDVVAGEMVAIARDLAPAEIARAKAQLRAGMLMSRESSSARAEHLGQQILVHGTPQQPVDLLAKLDAVTAADLERVAQRIAGGRPTVTQLGPSDMPEIFARFGAKLAA